jgi:hypothetical protein
VSGYRSSSNNPNLPLPVAIHTKSHKLLSISFGMYMYSRTCPLIPITSPNVILNLPINSSCSQDTALVLISDNLHLIFPPTPPLPVSQPPGSTYKKHSHVTIFTACSNTFLLFWSRKASVIAEIFQVSMSLCLYILSPGNLFIFWWVFPFLSYLLSYLYYRTFLSTWSQFSWLVSQSFNYLRNFANYY